MCFLENQTYFCKKYNISIMIKNINTTKPPKPTDSALIKIITPMKPISKRNKLNNKQPPNPFINDLSI